MTTLQEYSNKINKRLKQEIEERELKGVIIKEESFEFNLASDLVSTKNIDEGQELDLSEWEWGNLVKVHIDGSRLDSLLTKLNLGENKKITKIICPNNKLTSLDLSQCPNLQELDLEDNKLVSVDFLKQLPSPEKLIKLNLSGNNIQATDLKEISKHFVNLDFLSLNKLQFQIKSQIEIITRSKI